MGTMLQGWAWVVSTGQMQVLAAVPSSTSCVTLSKALNPLSYSSFLGEMRTMTYHFSDGFKADMFWLHPSRAWKRLFYLKVSTNQWFVNKLFQLRKDFPAQPTFPQALWGCFPCSHPLSPPLSQREVMFGNSWVSIILIAALFPMRQLLCIHYDMT